MAPHSVIPLRTRIAARVNLLPLPAKFDPRKGILLAGSSRSGTTWLGQMLATSPELCLVNEPFSPKMPGIPDAGFSWRTYCDPGDEWPEGKAAFRRVFSGKGVSFKLVRLNGSKLFRCRGLLVKEVRVNRLLPWIARHLDLRGIVVIVRHPCAVVSSQMAHFKLKNLSWTDDLYYLEQLLPNLIDFANGLETEEERRALTWSLDQHAALASLGSSAWTTASYESLVVRGKPELDRVFGHLRLVSPPAASEMLEQNSWQARKGSVNHESASVEKRLGVWRQRLTSDQIRRILSVVDVCGIKSFSDALLPDFQVFSEEFSVTLPASGTDYAHDTR